MTEYKRFIVTFKTGEEQPVVAAGVAVDEECLIFTHSDGQLAAFFDLTFVESWREDGVSKI